MGGDTTNNLFEKPEPHPAREWVKRAGFEMGAVAQRCGVQETYISAVLNGHYKPSEYVEDRLQSVIPEAKAVVAKREVEDAAILHA